MKNFCGILCPLFQSPACAILEQMFLAVAAQELKPTCCPCFKTALLENFLLQLEVQVGLLGILLPFARFLNVSNKNSPLLLAASNGLASVKPFRIHSLQLKFRRFQMCFVSSCALRVHEVRKPPGGLFLFFFLFFFRILVLRLESFLAASMAHVPAMRVFSFV